MIMPAKHIVPIHLLDLYTGETRIIDWDESTPASKDPYYTWAYAVQYAWFDGNWSCDCNRWPWWLMAGGMSNGRAYSMKLDRDSVCGEPRIRAKIELPEPQGLCSDWPDDEPQRLSMAAALKEARAKLFAEWDKQ